MTPLIIAITVLLSLAGLAMFLYGIFRKFTQMSWLSWQILVLFVVTLPLSWLPDGLPRGWKFAIALLAIFGGIAVVVGGSELIRLAMLKKRKPAHPAWRFFNRLGGGITALLDLAIVAVIVAAFVLPVIYYCNIPTVAKMLEPFFKSDVWTKFLVTHAFDIVIIAAFALAVRTGWREGFARTVVTVLLIALTLGALVLSVYLTFGVSFFSRVGNWLGHHIVTDNWTLATSIGHGFVFFFFFILFFALICVLGFFMVKLIRRIRFDYFWGFLDGGIGAAIAFAVTLLCVLGLYCGAMWAGGGQATELIRSAVNTVNEVLAQAGQGAIPLDKIESILSAVDGYAHGVGEMLAAPPISGLLFFGNPMSWGFTFV